MTRVAAALIVAAAALVAACGPSSAADAPLDASIDGSVDGSIDAADETTLPCNASNATCSACGGFDVPLGNAACPVGTCLTAAIDEPRCCYPEQGNVGCGPRGQVFCTTTCCTAQGITDCHGTLICDCPCSPPGPGAPIIGSWAYCVSNHGGDDGGGGEAGEDADAAPDATADASGP